MYLNATHPITYSAHGVPKYSERYKDVLYRFHLKQQQQMPQDVYEKKFQFVRVKMLGLGAHSMVNIVLQKKTQTLYAQKIIKKDRYLNSTLLSLEIKIHMKLQHQNIISLYHTYSDSEAIYLLMELGQQSLFSLLKRKKEYNDKQIMKILYDIIQAIGYLHKNSLVHGDIKTQNIVYSQGLMKLCDFGHSHPVGKSPFQEVVGTLEYLPPQYAQGYDSGFKRDIWAFGIICYQLVRKKNPLDNLSQQQKWLKLIKIQKQNLWQQEFKILEAHPTFKKIIQITLCEQNQRASWIKIALEITNSGLLEDDLCKYS